MYKKKSILRRVLTLALALVLLVPLAPAAVVEAEAVTQAEIDALKQKSASLASQRKDIQDQLAKVRAEKGELVSQKELLENDIALIQQKINNIQSLITKYTQLIAQKEEEIAAAEEALAAAEEDEAQLFELFCQRVRALEEGGQATYWSILFSSDSFSDLLDNFIMIEEFIQYDNSVMDEILALQAQIEAEKAALEEEQANLAEAKAEQEAAKAEQEEAKAELRSQENEVQKLINEISATESDLAAQEAALRAAANAADAEIKKKEKELASQISQVKSEGSYKWPLPGKTTLSSLFGNRKDPFTGQPGNHTGIDIPAAAGTSILCAKSGVVTVSTYNSGGYGQYVVVSHSDGTSTLYAHMTLGSQKVKVGDKVTQGQVLGLVGSTGRSTGNHLHFEIRVNGNRVDPVNYFSGLYYSSKNGTVKIS